MIYISERITNIAELEKIIENAKLHLAFLRMELKKDTPSKETINTSSAECERLLSKAERFEFHIERRKCELKDTD